MSMPVERQLNKATHNRRAGNAVRGLALVGIAASAAGFAGHANAETHSSNIVDTNSSNSRLINNPNTSDTLKVGGVNHEVVGLPQFRTVFSADLPKTILASKLADADGNVDVTIKPGSSISQELKDDLSAKGVQLQSAEQVKAVVEAVGELGHDMVNPGDSFSFSASAVAEGVQNANVEVQVAAPASPVAVENQQNDLSSVGVDTNVQKADENLAPVTEAEVSTGESDPIAEATATPESVVLAQAANAEATPATCYVTDYKGDIEKDANLTTSNPSVTHLQNIRTLGQTDCPPANVWFRTTAANQAPNTAGWLENQTPIISQITVHNADGSKTLTSTDAGMVTIPNSTDDLRVDVAFPKGNYCWIQEDVVRTSSTNVKDYNGDNMVNFAFYPNPDMDPVTCLPKATATSTVTFTPTNRPNTETPTPSETSTATFTATASPTVTFTPTATNTSEPGCTTSDVKGELNDLEDSNHLTGKDVTGKVSNIATNMKCFDDIYLHMYGSMEKPTGTGQNIGLNIESQRGNHILTKQIIVPENTVDMPIAVTIPQNKFCTVQVDLTLDGEIKDEPRYIDNDFLLFVDEENCNPKTATATATNTATSTVTFTPTSTFTETSTSIPNPTFTKTRVPSTATSTNTPVPPTSTSTRESMPTNTPKPKVTPGIVKDLPRTGVKSESRIAPWIAFGAGALGFMGLGSVGRGLNLLRAEDDEEEEKKKKKYESKS